MQVSEGCSESDGPEQCDRRESGAMEVGRMKGGRGGWCVSG